jgi:hypothetical protein
MESKKKIHKYKNPIDFQINTGFNLKKYLVVYRRYNDYEKIRI